MAESKSRWLLTSRTASAITVGLTALLFVWSVRDVPTVHKRQQGWLLPLDFFLHGWALVAANVIFYIWLLWLAFWFIRGTHGRERVVVVGWLPNILLPPLLLLRPSWTVGITYIGIFGLAVALLAAVSLLLHPAHVRVR